jgi:hypothetical protein
LRKDDIYQGRRYILVQTPKRFEETIINREIYLQNVSQIEDKLDSLSKNKNIIHLETNNISNNLKSYYERKINLQVNEIFRLGFFYTGEDAFSYIYIIKGKIIEDSKSIENYVASAMSVIWTKGKLIYLSAYSVLKDPSDVDWVKLTSHKMIDDIISKNRLIP